MELGGVLLANSLTLLADAVHMLTDSASLGLALSAAGIATRPADSRRTFGYHRAEVLDALVNGLFLVAVVADILVDAFGRLGDPRPVDVGRVVAVGVADPGANLAAAAVLSVHRDHLNVEGAFIHLLADAAGSVPAVLAGLVIWATGVSMVDALFAVHVAAPVLSSARDRFADSRNVQL